MSQFGGIPPHVMKLMLEKIAKGEVKPSAKTEPLLYGQPTAPKQDTKKMY